MIREQSPKLIVFQASIVLLTGPAGSGKTATVRAVAADLGVGVQEWINPMSAGVSFDSWSESGGGMLKTTKSTLEILYCDILVTFFQVKNPHIFCQILCQHVAVEENPR